LQHIWNYTLEQWGVEQAIRYVRAIEHAIASFESHPLRRMHVDGRRGLYAIKSGSHIIILRKKNGQPLVIRILHERMDIRRHLR
jgi:toxin ParE1/3/4